MTISRLLPEQPTNYKYQTNNYGSNDSALFRIGDNYVAPPNILPTKNISTLNEENVDANWLLMFACHLPYLNPSYSSSIAMGLEVNIREDFDWVKNAINWVKSFFGKDFQDHCHDEYVVHIVNQLKQIELSNFDPNSIKNLDDVCGFIKGPVMRALFETDRDKCFNILFKLYRRIGLSVNQRITEEIVMKYFDKNGVKNIQLGEIAYNRSAGSKRKHCFVVLAMIANTSLLQRFKDCELAAFGCYLYMERKVTNENSDKWTWKFDIVKINGNLAPKDRVDKKTGVAMYYVVYENIPRSTNAQEVTDAVKRIASVAIMGSITLDVLISQVSNAYNEGMHSRFRCHVIATFVSYYYCCCIFVSELSRQTHCVPTMPPLDNPSTLELSLAVDSNEAVENDQGSKATDVDRGNDDNHDISISGDPTLPTLDNHFTPEISSAGDSNEADENDQGSKAMDVVRGNDANHDISTSCDPTMPPLDTNPSTLEVSLAVDSNEAVKNYPGSNAMNIVPVNDANHDISTNTVTDATLPLTPKVKVVGGLKDRVGERKVFFFLFVNDAVVNLI